MDWLQESPTFILFAIFLVSFLESFALLGVLVPGVVLLFSLAVLAHNLDISPLAVLIFGGLGAFIGDVLSFFLGQKLKGNVERWPWLKRHQSWLEQGAWFIQRWGWLSVIIGRFLGPLRPVIPLVAGTLGMPAKLFVPLNLLTVFVWAPAYLLPGYFTGELSQLWAVQPISNREITIYVLTIIAVLLAAISIYHHAHPSRWFLRGWITRHQADRWPITSLSFALFCLCANAIIWWFGDIIPNAQFLIWSTDWRSAWLTPAWSLINALGHIQYPHFSIAVFLAWIALNQRWHFFLLEIAALTALKAFANINIGTLPEAGYGLMLGVHLTALFANLFANEFSALKRWPIYLGFGLLVIISNTSFLWLGLLTISQAGFITLTALSVNALQRAVWQYYNLWQSPYAGAMGSLLLLSSLSLSLLSFV